MKNILSIGIIAVCIISQLILSGCGYHMGSTMHPQVKSIAIAPITSDALDPMAGPYMRQFLAEQFQFDGSLKVKGMEEADCILYGRIMNVRTTAVGHESYDNEQRYTPSEWTLEVKFEFTVLIPGREKPLVGTRQVIGRATYQVMADHEVTRRLGIRQACREAARQAVIYTTEAW